MQLQRFAPFAFCTLSLLVLLLAGCPKPEEPPPAPRVDDGQPVRILVLDDPQLAEVIEKTWRARSEAPLEVRSQRSSELGATSRLGADAVIYPSGLLGELAERNLLLPLADDMQADPQLNQHDVLDMVRLREIRWGEEVYAVSFGSPVFLLAYRHDIFEKAGVQPPTTWEEYQRLVTHLAKRENLGDAAPPADQPWYGTVEAWGAGWGSQTLLARAASGVRHHNQYSDLFDFASMRPLVGGPPFVRALEQLAATAEFAPPESKSYSPHDAYRTLAVGQAAMAICWPPSSQVAARANSAEKAEANLAIRWTELPGSREAYNFSEDRWEARGPQEPIHVPLLAAAGRLGSVTRETSRAKAALHVLAVLSGEWSVDIAPASSATTIYRQSHLISPTVWCPADADPEAVASYANAAHASLTRGVWMFSPRIPGREQYLAALDEAVQKTLAGEASPQEALFNVAEQWTHITEQRGREKQIDAYERSLGLEP